LPEVEIVCLANSRKIGDRCVAGLRTDGQGWIRPVTDSTSGGLTYRNYTLDNGRPAELLDVIRLTLSTPKPEVFQPENWIVASDRWRFIRKLSHGEASRILASFRVVGPDLFGNQSDRIALTSLTVNPASASLALVEPRQLEWQVTTNINNRRQTRASFLLGGCQYSLVVTDSVWHAKLRDLSFDLGYYSNEQCGVRAQDRILLTVSLGQPLSGGDCYKLVAGVVVLEAEG